MADGDGVGGGTGLGSNTQKEKEKTFAETVAEVGAAQAEVAPKATSANDPLVYLGGIPSGLASSPLLWPVTSQLTGTLSEVTSQYYDWSQKTRDKFLSQLNLAGYDTNNLKDAQIASLWAGYAQQAASYFAAGKKISPWDILAKDMEQREAYAKTPRTVTQTSTNLNLSTNEDAHAIFLQAAQSLLGRDPTKSEINSFQKSLNVYERANPTVTKTTTNYMGDDVTGQSSTTSGGVSAESRSLMAMEGIKDDPEYGAFQAATTYFDAMMQEIGG